MNIFHNLFSGNILYYPGCLSKFVAKDLVENYRQLLRRQGIDFIELPDLEVCCGSPVKNAGFQEEFEKLARRNLETFRAHGVSKIITHCPACAYVFGHDYSELLGKEWPVEVKHISQILSPKNENSSSTNSTKLTYHDPCHLGRYAKLYEEPRRLLRGVGFQISEMDLNREQAFCCGGGGGLRANNPELSAKVAEERIMQAEKTGAPILCTACPLCYLQLKQAAEKKGSQIEVKELGQILLEEVPNPKHQ